MCGKSPGDTLYSFFSPDSPDSLVPENTDFSLTEIIGFVYVYKLHSSYILVTYNSR